MEYPNPLTISAVHMAMRQQHRIKRYKRTGGFTLVEMLGVLFIVAMLVGILFPTISKVRSKAKIASAMTQIEALSVALRMYESDLGKYPPNTTSSGGELYQYLGTRLHSAALNIDVGPFMEFKSKDLGAGNSFKDPWSNAYVYASRDGSPAATHNMSSFDIHSPGPDGSSSTADDVHNW